MTDTAIHRFSAPVREWFTTSFAAATPAQEHGWPAIAEGAHTLILAPTGSGKTLAAFLWAIDELTRTDPSEDDTGVRVLYISPLKALAVDVDRNLRAPLRGIELAAERLGTQVHVPTVGIRTGDTPADERRRMARNPPEILITTPESLYLLLTSKARETLRTVDTVIVDEIHAVAGTKRGGHLALSLERLAALREDDGPDGGPQRIGLSATQRPLDEIARFLGGYGAEGPRHVAVVDAGMRKEMELEIVVPIEDMGRLGEPIEEPASDPAAAGPPRRSIWPSIHPRLLDLIYEHRTTLIFCNARRLAERLAAALNELHRERMEAAGEIAGGGVGSGGDDGEELVRAHHGSLAHEQRRQVEDDLKSGRLRGIVATSSLELGIDMGAIDLVVQVESPGSVARGLQRIGRAGHRVGEPSRGKLFPKYRGDLLETAVVVARMREGGIEETRYPRNPLDVLAQQIVAMSAMDEWGLDDLAALVRRAAPFADLTDAALTATLDMLAGRYPSEEFSELRPRIVWDRVAGVIRGRDNAQRLAVTNPGTIPDRGLFGVFLPDGARVGELDEEMVYESRSGETFTLGASTWRIEEITRDRVVVTPAPGQPGKMPFWHGDRPGRPLELGRAVGAFVREVREDPPAAEQRLVDEGLDPLAARNLISYLDEQAEATGTVPDDRTIVVERFRDEIGDWRVCLLSPFGARIHAPWALAVERRLRDRLGLVVESMWSDDGIVLRLPEAVEEVEIEELLPDPDEIEATIVEEVPSSALFAARFRECAARALLLPRRRPGSRTPLWQQRQRAGDLLEVAAKYPSFPILLETSRECLRDVFDLPGLKAVLGDVRARRVRVTAVETEQASPFAQSLLFGWIAAYMYEGDAPLAERRAAALALDRDLLRDLLGAAELRELIDAEVLAELELELQHLADDRRARDADSLHDLLRRLGPLALDEVEARTDGPGRDWATELTDARRAIRVRVAGEERIAAAEDAGLLRDALGVAAPTGLPEAFVAPLPPADGPTVSVTDHDPLARLVARYARVHGPFLAEDVAVRLGVPVGRVEPALEALEDEGKLVRGEFRPGGTRREWCDDDVLRRLRRRTLAALRREIEPVEGRALGRFLPGWHGLDGPRRGDDALLDAVSQLQGAAIPASILEADVLPARVTGYRESDLDALLATGDVIWCGAGALGANDGRVVLLFRDQADLLRIRRADDAPTGRLHDTIRRHLAEAGASFWPDIARAADGSTDHHDLLTALWDLVWAGEVTNDTLAPLRAFLAGRPRRGSGRRRRRGRPDRLRRAGPPAAAGRWSLSTEPRTSDTALAHAWAEQLLDRHGVLTRGAVLGEDTPGGFAGLYPVLRAMEEAGRVRRGYFIAGLGGAQFALPGAVDRLRAARGDDDLDAEQDVRLVAAADPAQPYGAALPWPRTEGRVGRQAGAYVVLVSGELAVYLERGGRTLVTFEAAGEPHPGTEPVWLVPLLDLVRTGRRRRLDLRRIDGEQAADSPWAPVLRAHGFVDTPAGLSLRGRPGSGGGGGA